MGKAKVAPTAAPHNPAQYVLGKKYGVRENTAQGNMESWGVLVQALSGGPQTRAQLESVLAPRNHKPFVGYCIRRGWLIPQAQ